MKEPRNALCTFGILVSAVIVTVAIPAGCESNKSGLTIGLDGSAGTGGGTQPGGTGGKGTGGMAAGGAGGKGTGGLGTGGMVAGGAGGKGTGGIGAGGIGTGGIGAGGIGTGGILPGVGGRGTGGVGAGGTSSGGAGGKATGGNGTGGTGTGGRTGGAGGRGTGGAGGVGGAGSGGVTSRDGGSPDSPPPVCTAITTQAACDLRTDCHSVFEDPGTCGCATPGCCARFKTCADGDKADCVGPALCKMVEPFCEAPYVVAFKDTCYEGCVRKTDCALPNCPKAPPKDTSACERVDHACYYEDCAGAGRTLAACSAGTWKVETGACTTLTCEGVGITPGTLTCAAGKLCVITTSGGGAYMVTPTCVDHTCGTGPISLACVSSAYGTCTATYALTGAVFRCQEPFTGAP